MTTWTTFANLTTPTLPELDANFLILSGLVNVPCTVAGTNTLTLTSTANTSTLATYLNYLTLVGVAVNTNSGAVTANFQSFGALNVYKDTPGGPQVLTGSEIVQNCEFTLIYDSALNSGAGGFHLKDISGPLFNTQLSTVSFGAIGAQASAQATVAFANVAVNDNIIMGLPAAPAASVAFSAFVSAAGSVVVRAGNYGSVSVNPGSATYRLTQIGFTG